MTESTIKENINVIGDTVYVHENIQEIIKIDKTTDEKITFYRYTETKYTKDEFIKLLYEKIIDLEKKLNLGGT